VLLPKNLQMQTILNTQKDKTNYFRTVVLYTIVFNSSNNPGRYIDIYIYIYIHIHCINIQVTYGLLNARFAEPAETLFNLNAPREGLRFRTKRL
jgi:hypothetical protein